MKRKANTANTEQKATAQTANTEQTAQTATIKPIRMDWHAYYMSLAIKLQALQTKDMQGIISLAKNKGIALPSAIIEACLLKGKQDAADKITAERAEYLRQKRAGMRPRYAIIPANEEEKKTIELINSTLCKLRSGGTSR